MLQFPYPPSKSAGRRKPEGKDVNANQHHPSDVARNHLLASLNALAADDCVKCSQHLWLAARQAAAVVAQRRGWPAASDAEIKAAMRRIDAENGKEPDAAADSHTAELFRDNANYDFLEKDEVIWFQPIVHGFVNRMLALNDRAHYNGPFDADDTDRAIDSIERLPTSIDATAETALVNRLKDERRREGYGSPVQPPPATGYPMATPSEPLQPIVRRLMSVLLEDHPTLLDDADVLNLLNSDYCQNELRLQTSGFALLRTEREGRSVSGHSRYWAKLYAGKYYVCSQWWKDYHRHNAGSLLRFVTKFVQGNPGHPGIPALVEIEKMLTDYIAQSAA